MAELNEEFFKQNFNPKDLSINDFLSKGERILWHQKPKAKSYIISKIMALTPFAIMWLIFDSFFISGFVIAINQSRVPLFVSLFVLVFFVLHLTPVWLWVSSMIKAHKDIKNTEYYITNKRVIITNFPKQIEIKEMSISDIKDVNLIKGGIDRLVRVGDIQIKSEEKSIVLYDIREPEKIYSIFEKIKTRYQNLENLQTYKICEYCNNRLEDNENKCKSCGAAYHNEKIAE